MPAPLPRMTKKEPVKKERDVSPPLPPARIKKEKEDRDKDRDRDRDRDRSNGATTASQRRRESAMYTSSEEEGEEGEDTSGTSLMRNSTATRKAANGNANGSNTKSLRARYQASYMAYLDTFRTAMSQKERIEALLEGGSEAGDAASLSEGELLDFDGLNKLVGETKNKWEELKGIQKEWEGLRDSKSGMVGVGRE